MALSDYEKQVLEEMEAQFGSQPASFNDHSRPNANVEQQPARLSPRKVAAGALMIVAGLLVLIAAVSLGYSVISLIVGVAGFLLMVGALGMRSLRREVPRVRAKSEAPLWNVNKNSGIGVRTIANS